MRKRKLFGFNVEPYMYVIGILLAIGMIYYSGFSFTGALLPDIQNDLDAYRAALSSTEYNGVLPNVMDTGVLFFPFTIFQWGNSAVLMGATNGGCADEVNRILLENEKNFQGVCDPTPGDDIITNDDTLYLSQLVTIGQMPFSDCLNFGGSENFCDCVDDNGDGYISGGEWQANYDYLVAVADPSFTQYSYSYGTVNEMEMWTIDVNTPLPPDFASFISLQDYIWCDSKDSIIFATNDLGTASVVNSVVLPVERETPLLCPQFAPSSPDFCSGGTIVEGGLDSNGCPLPPSCEYSSESVCCKITPVVPNPVSTYEVLLAKDCDNIDDSGNPILGSNKEVADMSFCEVVPVVSGGGGGGSHVGTSFDSKPDSKISEVLSFEEESALVEKKFDWVWLLLLVLIVLTYYYRKKVNKVLGGVL